ncbi:hypothetical protein [Kitasatospora sp. NPDC088134]|uniref:hypothetical protein n=1 Tax=Kitasatospora sp. NPDC088134 TaxID=3364071 RepID=UPI00380EC4E3
MLAASAAGHLHQREALPVLMALRTSDIDHLIRAGLLTPAETTRSSHHRRTVVPLYRWADLQRLLNSRRIDWEQVCATPPGRRSPLAELPDVRPAAAR